MDKEYINPLNGQPLDKEHLDKIVKEYGSFDNWIKHLKKSPVGRSMLATDVNAKGGDKEFKERQRERQEAGIGAMNKIMDGIAEAAHYLPSTAAVMDMVDVVRSSEGSNTDGANQVVGAVGSAGGSTIKEYMKHITKGADATNAAFVNGFGRMASSGVKVAGMLDDVKQTVQTVKDIVKTPNRDYKSKYFDSPTGTVESRSREPKEQTDDNPWML